MLDKKIKLFLTLAQLACYVIVYLLVYIGKTELNTIVSEGVLWITLLVIINTGEKVVSEVWDCIKESKKK